jgi:hypothetical protein
VSGFEKLLQKFSNQESDDAELPCPPPSTAGNLESFIQKFGHVTEEYSFYNGTIKLRFNVDEHRYYLIEELGNLTPLDGVTTAVGIIDKSMMLTPWAAKMMALKLLRIIPVEVDDKGETRIKPLTLAEFTVYVMEAKGAHKEKLDEASDTGHAAHKCIEDSIRFALANDPEKKVRDLINLPQDERAVNCANGAKSWMDKHNVRWVETESKVYSKEYRYAGTMDGLCVVDSCGDPACCPQEFKDRLSLADWKSSNSLKLEYLFQVSGYKHAKMEEFPELNIVDIWILRLGKSEEEAGKFEPWHMTPDEYDEDFQGFLACLNLTRLVDSVHERMKGQKDTIRKVRKVQRETAKALAKEQEKLQKVLEKAAKKVEREAEKLRIKEEARVERERLKAEKKKAKEAPCTSSENGNTEKSDQTTPLPATKLSTLDSSVPEDSGSSKSLSAKPMESSLLKPKQESLSTISTEATECTSTSSPNPISTPLVTTVPTESSVLSPTTKPAKQQPSESTFSTGVATSQSTESTSTTPIRAASSTELQFEEEVIPTFVLPMEG